MTDEITTLARRLDADPSRLHALRAYDGVQVARLDAAVAAAIAEEDRAFEEALSSALALVPRMLRGTAQRLLGGHRG